MTPIHLRAEYWGINVPADAINFEISRPFNDRFHLNWGYPDPLVSSGMCLYFKYFGGKKNYPKHLEIVCLSKEVTDKVASTIVERRDSEGRGFIFLNYENGMYVFSRATSSLRSLLRSKGLDPNNTLILKKTV